MKRLLFILLLSSIFGTVTDIDGNVYETVQIGQQLWMAENLRVTQTRNGEPLGYYIYNNDSDISDIYGFLYTYDSYVQNSDVCPEGWRVPTAEDISDLSFFLSGEDISFNTQLSVGGVGGKLKECQVCPESEYWSPPNTGATNESAFTALPAGWKVDWAEDFANLNRLAVFWTTFEQDFPYAVLMFDDSDALNFWNTNSSVGASIRCLSDEIQSSTILVPDDFATIQEAIDYSIDGDTILVSAGTYYENINFNGKNISVIGEDRETTIIDGNQNGSVVTLNGSESGLLDGFTIQNGLSQQWGGGIYCHSSNLDIINCQISNNTSSYNGAGIHINDESTVTIANSIISNNEALSSSDGGGIAASGDVILNNVNIINNTASNGAGVNVQTKTFTMNGGSISGNTSYSPNQEGGALQIQDAISVSLDGVEFANNNYDDGTGQGSAIGIRRTDTDITNCIIRDNSSGRGAIYIHDADVNISTTLIIDNTASNPSNNYGAIFNWHGVNLTLDKVTFANNTKSAIHNDSNDANITINNSIFWNPDANEEISNRSSGNSVTVSYSNLWYWYCDEYSDNMPTDCSNLIYEDPQFNDDYTLQATSPCIDAGDPESELDPDGTIADMGAYYYDQIENPIIYGCMDEEACNYDENATIDDENCLYNDCFGECGGDSVEDNFGVCGGNNTIQGALNYYGDNANINIPSGTYYESLSITNNNVSLSCDGGAILDVRGMLTGIDIIGSNILILDCEIIGDEATTHGIVIRPNSSDITIQGNVIHGMTLANQSNTSPLAYGILAYGNDGSDMPSNLIFNENNIYGVAGSAISLGSWTNEVSIEYNNFHDIIPVDYMEEQLSVGVQAQLAQNVYINNNAFSNLIIGSNLLFSQGYVNDNVYDGVASLLTITEASIIDFENPGPWWLAETTVEYEGINFVLNSYASSLEYAILVADDGSTIISYNGDEIIQDCFGDWGGDAVVDDCGICDGENTSCSGCTDPYALNYNEEAIVDDGTCEYPALGDMNNDAQYNVIDVVLLINYLLEDIYVIYGDLNQDGVINVLDVVILINWILDGEVPATEECFLEPDIGPCDGVCPRYFYNQEIEECEVFMWGCCDGVVPFDTLEECEDACE